MKIERFSRLSSWVFTRPKTAGFLIFLLLFVGISFIVLQRYHIVKENEHREMSNILRVIQQNVNQNLNNCYTTTLTLALTVNDEGEPEDFISTAEKLKNTNHFVDALQLVPDGVIRYVYPLDGNQKALGYDILNSNDVSQEAQISIKTKKMYFAGPLNLKQGGMGVVGRLPIFKKDKFWGFSAVIISFDKLLEASGINSIDDSKYYFQFSKENPNTGETKFFLSTDQNFKDKTFEFVSIPDGNWKIYLINKSRYAIFFDLLPSSTFALLFAMILTFFLVNLLKRPHELQILLNDQAHKLLSNEQKFEAIFKQAPVGIVHVNTQSGKLIQINKKFRYWVTVLKN